MVPLEGTRTNSNLKHAFSDEGRFDRLYLNHEQTAEAAGYREFAALARMAATSGARYARGHLDYLVAGHGPITTPGMPTAEFSVAMSAMIEEHGAMYAGMARTARDEKFEEIADWFETLAKAGRSHARRMRRAVEKYEIET
jgi:rubrerythrin